MSSQLEKKRLRKAWLASEYILANIPYAPYHMCFCMSVCFVRLDL